MKAETIIQEIDSLPLKDKLFVIEQTLQTIRLKGEHQLDQIVDNLYEDYKTDVALTEFTLLDKEPFYETK